jgi:hypothetical protein
MSKQTINIGASPNDGTGTPLRTSFDYTNQNFTELYTAVGPSGNNIVVPGTATITGDLTVDTSTLKVDSTNNRVGIGTASPTAALSVSLAEVSAAAGTAAIITNTTSGGNRIAALRLSNLSNQWNIRAYGAVTDDLRFGSGSTGSETDYLTVNTSGNVTVSTGNVVMATSGKGIDFSATASGSGTMTSELLNDYEEGTFTPTVAGSTVAGTLTAPIANGYYTKVGSLVTVQVYIGWTNLVGATGYMILGGLPFAASSNPNIYSAVSFSYINYISLTAGYVLTGMINPGTSYVELGQYPTGGGASTTVPIDTAASIMYTATYRV